MAKVSGSYESVVRGVSEQVPQDRRSGQHTEQVNMVSDPVRGNARRHGSVMQDEVVLADYTPGGFAAMLDDTAAHRSVTFYVDGIEYDFVARTVAGTSSFAWAFNRKTRRFVPVVMHGSDPVLNQLAAGGMSAAVNIGKYLFIAGNTVVPSYTTTKAWESADNQRYAAIWIRGGAYARTFSVTVIKADGSKVVASYKTLASSYPELLSTTDLLASDPNYQKNVNDRVNAYNSKATAWIGQAAADITPENIAQKLADALNAQGIASSRVGGTIVIDAPDIREIIVDDGGDDSLIHAAAQEVTAAELVTTVHRPGKIVRVRPKRSAGDDAFYLEAVPKEAGATGWTNVYWREAAGVVTTPTSAFVLATVVDGKLYMASNAARLQELTGLTDVPAFKPSGVGDELTTPVPYFLGKKIDYLGVFQDRLVIGCDAVLLFSRPGDYFNWFRQSVLTVADDDPVEEFALGSEDDTITASAFFDRNLIFFGKRFWYSVSGTVPLTPKANGVVILREEPEANLAPPKASDNFVFYCKASGDNESQPAKLHQVQAGLLADSPEGTDIASQLDDYIKGNPLEIVAVTSPNTVFLRTTGSRQELYTYAYLDTEQGGQRLFDAWSKWAWHEKTGHLVAISRDRTELLAYMLRHDGQRIWLSCERFTLASVLSSRPYADSLRPLAAVLAGQGYIRADSALVGAACVAMDNSTEYRFLGVPIEQIDEFVAERSTLAPAFGGIVYPAYVTPTNPFIRDRNDRAVLSGRLTLVKVQVTVADTAGLVITVDGSNGTKTALDFNGRILAAANNQVGRQPVVSTTLSGLIGKEVRECSYTLTAKTWLPLTITGLEWTGQYFNNTRRV